MVEAFAHWVIRWRYAIIIATLLFVAAAASGGRFLVFTTDYRVFFSEKNPQLIAFENLQNTYTKNDNVLIILAPEDGKVFTRENLEAVLWTTQEAWQIPYSIRVDSVTNFQHTHAQEDDLIVEDLVTDPKSLSDDALEKIKQVALQEPSLLHRLIPPQTHVTAVNVTVQLPGKRPHEEIPEIVTFVRNLADQVTVKFPQMKVYLTGIVMMNNSFPEATRQDLTTLVPAMYAVILITLALLLRMISGTFATFLVISFSIVSAMGIAGWLGIKLTGPSSAAPTIILTLSVADSVHLLATMLHEMRVNNRDKFSAIVESLRVNFQPVFLTSLTTLIGFLSMNFGEVPPFADLGNIVSIGVIIAFFLSILLLPAVMAVLPVKVKHVADDHVHAMDAIAEFVIRRRFSLLWTFTVLSIVLTALIPKNELNDVFVEYFDKSFAFRQATDFASENLTGLYDIHYSLSAGKSQGISDPEFLQKVEDFANWYRQQPKVMHVNTITDTFKRLNKNLHGDDPNYYRLPDQPDLAAQYLLLYEMSLPFGLDLNNQINVDKSATRLSITLNTISTNELLALEEKAQQWLHDHGLPSMQVHGSSTAIMFANIGYRNIRGMLIGATVALVLISFVLIVALRSVKYGLISLIPNLVPAGITFGLWAIFVGEIGLALSVVAGISLGIIVDDTIHFLSKYLRAHREKGLSPAAAVRYAFRSVGMALWITSVVLVAGFLILAQSHFTLNSGMGLLTAIVIAIALIVDFLYLSPLLMQFEKEKSA